MGNKERGVVALQRRRVPGAAARAVSARHP